MGTGLAFEWLPGTLANYPPSFSSSTLPGFLHRSHARKQSADGSERERQRRVFSTRREREKNQKKTLPSFTSPSSVHPSDLLKPCLTETTLQVFRLRGDHGVTEETKNPQDVECMFGTAPASQEDIKDDGFAAIGLSTFSSASHLPQPDRSCRGSSSGWAETKEKSPAAPAFFSS